MRLVGPSPRRAANDDTVSALNGHHVRNARALRYQPRSYAVPRAANATRPPIAPSPLVAEMLRRRRWTNRFAWLVLLVALFFGAQLLRGAL